MMKRPFPWIWILLLACQIALQGVAADTPAPRHLTLYLPLSGGVEALKGPQGEQAGPAPGIVTDEDGQKSLRLAEEKKDGHGRIVHAPPEPILRFPAGGLLHNAHGTVSFWIRAPRVFDPQAKDFPTLMQLTGGNGGTWSLAIREIPYTPAETKASVAELQEQQRLFLESQDVGLTTKRPGTEKTLETTESPVATLQCQVRMTLWPEGEASTTIAGSAHSTKDQAWHHVAWTWKSLHHELYVDGQRVGTDTPQNSISRMAPFMDNQARLDILRCSANIHDLRLFDRWLAPEHISMLAQSQGDDTLPELPAARIWADWAYSTGRSVVFVDAAGAPDAVKATIRCVDVKQGKPVGEPVVTGLPDRLGEAVMRPFDPNPFPAGVYRYEAVLQDANGNEVAKAATEDWVCEAPPWPFLGFTGGRRDKAAVSVIPPFTPVVVEVKTIGISMRSHLVGRNGLFESIIAAGSELLADPIHVDVVSDGKPVLFDQGAGLGEIRHDKASADWQAENKSSNGHVLKISAHLEYDGVTRFDVTLIPSSKLAVDRVELVIPFRQEIARLCHSGQMLWFGAIDRKPDGTWTCSRTSWAGPGGDRKRRPGVLFDTFDKTLSLFPPPVRETYTPYMHIGNDRRGLSWFVDNDQNWIYDPSVPNLEFVAENDKPFLRLNLVAKPTAFEAPVTWRFYLLANPFKPLPPKWRAWGVGQNRPSNPLTKKSGQLFWWHWSEYAGSFRPYPGPAVSYDGKKVDPDSGAHASASAGSYDSWRGKFKNDGIRHLPFINFGTPGGFPGFTPECMVYPYTWKLHNNQPFADYMAYWLDRGVVDIGIDGVYIDEPYVDPYSYNILAGDEPYVRPDGTRGIGFRYMEGREYIRRLKQLFTDHGIDYSIWLHDTNYRALPVMTFADIGMDGEHPSIWVPEFDDYHIFYNAIQSRGYLSSLPFGFVGSQMFHGNTNPKGDDVFPRLYRKCRTYLAVTFPNGVLPMSTSLPDELDRIQTINAAFGLADFEPEELTLDNLKELCKDFKIEPALMSLTALRLPQQERSLLYASAMYASATSGIPVLSGDLLPLGGGKPFVHLWDAENGVSLRVDDQWKLAIPPADFGCFWVEGREKPQASRLPGVWLGASFDKGLEPDFGGGLLPVVPLKGDVLPKPVAGRAGECLPLDPDAPAVAYPIVPNWVSGSIQFDLKMERTSGAVLTLLRLRHYLDLDLQFTKKNAKPGLLLTVREKPFVHPIPAGETSAPDKTLSVFAPFPESSSDGWNRILLTWAAGRYRLYADGKEIGAITDLVCPRLRDSEAPARGIVLGDGSGGPAGGSRGLMDSVLVYDWTLGEKDVQTAQSKPALQPVPYLMNDEAFSAWHDGGNRDFLQAAATFKHHPAQDQVTHVRFTLVNQADARKPLASLETVPWQGLAWASLSLKTPSAPSSPEFDKALDGPKAVSLEYALLVELLAKGGPKGEDVKVLSTRRLPYKKDPLREVELGF